MTFLNFTLYQNYSEPEKNLYESNQSDLLIVYKGIKGDKKAEFSSFSDNEKTEHIEFLTNILKAIGKKIENVSRLNVTHSKECRLKDVENIARFKQIVIFGLEPKDLGLQIQVPKYELFQWGDCTYLFSDSFESLLANKDKKIKLWKNLQSLFLNK